MWRRRGLYSLPFFVLFFATPLDKALAVFDTYLYYSLLNLLYQDAVLNLNYVSTLISESIVKNIYAKYISIFYIIILVLVI